MEQLLSTLRFDRMTAACAGVATVRQGDFYGFFGGDGLGGFLGQRRDGGEHQRAQQGAEYTLQGHGMFLLVVAAPARADAVGSDYSTKRLRIQCFNAQVHGLFTV